MFAAFLLIVLGCHKNRDLTHSIDMQIRAGAKVVDIAQLADFDWDHLFVFWPYSSPDVICKVLGFSSHECSAAAFKDVDEGEFLLVFLKDRTICYRENFSRLYGNFDKSCLGRPIAKA